MAVQRFACKMHRYRKFPCIVYPQLKLPTSLWLSKYNGLPLEVTFVITEQLAWFRLDISDHFGISFYLRKYGRGMELILRGKEKTLNCNSLLRWEQAKEDKTKQSTNNDV